MHDRLRQLSYTGQQHWEELRSGNVMLNKVLGNCSYFYGTGDNLTHKRDDFHE